MKMNNKGFTLVELLAAIAILGILSIYAVPRIFSLIDSSRKEIYVQDGTRFLAQAKYKLNSHSSQIEKPDNGKCILISLGYLHANDLGDSPGGGLYMLDRSFVVVKNNAGKYEYALTLIEEIEDDGGNKTYKGLELVKESDINKSHVKNYTTDSSLKPPVSTVTKAKLSSAISCSTIQARYH